MLSFLDLSGLRFSVAISFLQNGTGRKKEKEEVGGSQEGWTRKQKKRAGEEREEEREIVGLRVPSRCTEAAHTLLCTWFCDQLTCIDPGQLSAASGCY